MTSGVREVTWLLFTFTPTILSSQGMAVPVYAFPRPIATLKYFKGRLGNFLEHGRCCPWRILYGTYGTLF